MTCGRDLIPHDTPGISPDDPRIDHGGDCQGCIHQIDVWELRHAADTLP